jgi:hypothetical protein
MGTNPREALNSKTSTAKAAENRLMLTPDLSIELSGTLDGFTSEPIPIGGSI